MSVHTQVCVYLHTSACVLADVSVCKYVHVQVYPVKGHGGGAKGNQWEDLKKLHLSVKTWGCQRRPTAGPNQGLPLEPRKGVACVIRLSDTRESSFCHLVLPARGTTHQPNPACWLPRRSGWLLPIPLHTDFSSLWDTLHPHLLTCRLPQHCNSTPGCPIHGLEEGSC